MDVLTALIAVSCVSLLAVAALADDSAAARPHHALVSTTASERGTSGVDNKIVTLDGKTHAVWQDSTDQGYVSVARTLDRESGEWSPPVTLGPGVDNHARPCLTVDSKGFLHAVIGGHNTPLRYLRSAQPNSTAEWVENHTFGRGTYTSIICGRDDVLVVSARPAGVGTGRTGVDLYVRKPGDAEWTHRRLVLEKEPQYTGYVGYNASIMWGPDGTTLHFAADVYEGPGVYENRGINQAVVYMLSRDLGDTWQRSDGVTIAGKPYPKHLDVIYLNNRKREQGMPTPICRLAGMVVDSSGTPVVLYTQHEPNPGEAHLVTPDGSRGWRRLPLADAIFEAYPGFGALGARGALSITADDRIQALIPIGPIEGLRVPGRITVKDEDIRYVFISSADGGNTFSFSQPIPDLPGAQFVPTVEKPSGHHVIAPGRNAAFIYIEGLHRYPRGGEVIQNHAYFVEMPRGE